jgi:hypothetical protein
MNSWQWQFTLRFMRVVILTLLIDRKCPEAENFVLEILVEGKRDFDQNWKSPYPK